MLKQTRIYLDNAATTPLVEPVRLAMAPYLAEQFGNPSSPYCIARNARMAVDTARRQTAQLIGAHDDEIVFTSGGTESDNWALLGVALANWESGKRHVVVSAIEHPAVLKSAELLAELGFCVDHAPVNEHGLVDSGAVGDLLRDDTILVSIMAVNNETGVIQPVAEIARICRERGVTFHTDGVQTAGKIPVDVAEMGVDLLSLSAHKIGGPKGTGALFIKRGTRMKTMMRGGSQEGGRRAGTENVAGIVGMGAAAQVARENLPCFMEKVATLRDKLELGLATLTGAAINGADAPRAPHITNVTLPGQRAESLALGLDLAGIAVGTGSACSSGAQHPSRVLAAMGLDADAAKASLRISLSLNNTVEEMDELLEELAELVAETS